MPDWWLAAFQSEPHLSVAVVVIRLSVALAFGFAVAGVFWLAQQKANAQSLAMMATLVMLTVLIAMLTLVIGESQARAFSLVGALAIIRFRTVVEDTRDTAFVIFAVAVGMAVASGYLTIAILGIPFAGVAALLIRPRRSETASPNAECHLTLRVGAGCVPSELFRESFAKHLEQSRLIGTSTVRAGAAIELIYAVRLRDVEQTVGFVAELNGLAGVQQVELRQVT